MNAVLRHWRYAAALALAVGAFLAGRFLTPPTIETKVETRVEWRDRIVEREVKVEQAAKERIITRTVERPGRESIKTVVVEHSVTTGASGWARDTTSEGKGETVRTDTPVRPQWRLGVDVGASLREPLVPIAGPLVLGARAEYRVAGPVWVGVWASTQGAAGVVATVEW